MYMFVLMIALGGRSVEVEVVRNLPKLDCETLKYESELMIPKLSPNTKVIAQCVTQAR